MELTDIHDYKCRSLYRSVIGNLIRVNCSTSIAQGKRFQRTVPQSSPRKVRTAFDIIVSVEQRRTGRRVRGFSSYGVPEADGLHDTVYCFTS